MPNESTTDALKALRLRSGLSMQAIAKKLGYANASSYQHYEDPAKFTKPHLPLPVVRALMQALVGLGNPAIRDREVLMLAGLEDLTPKQTKAFYEQTLVWCIGEAVAGSWREAMEWPRDEWIQIAVATRDGRYPGVMRSALIVRGDSMDQVYPDGSLVLFVRIEEAGAVARSGDRVVAVRRRHDLLEATIKEYYVDNKGQKWLMPKSSNPAHAPQPLKPTENGDTACIFGLVVGSQRVE